MSYAVHDNQIKTKDGFKSWILRKLGSPLISVELTDDQLTDCIDDSISEYIEYASNDTQFYAICFKDYVENVGITLPKNIVGIRDLNSNVIGPGGQGAGKIDNYMNDLLMNGAVSFPMFGRGGGGGWLGYELSMQYLNLSQRMLGGDYDFTFNYRTRNLKLIPDPVTTSNVESGWAVLHVLSVDEDSVQYGENWVKRMALAIAKVTLGTIRSKFMDMHLPGGGRIDTGIRDEGIKERDELREELLDKNPIISIIKA